MLGLKTHRVSVDPMERCKWQSYTMTKESADDNARLEQHNFPGILEG